MQRLKSTTRNLADLYEDKDGSRKAEITSMTGANEFSEFYSRLRSIKESYKNNPNEVAIPMSVEFDEFLKSRESENNLVDFTDEEGYGRFFDLNQCFNLYLNVKGLRKLDYLTYLHTFDRLYEIPKERKLQADYRRYLDSLLSYLSEFCYKVKPLFNLEAVSVHFSNSLLN